MRFGISPFATDNPLENLLHLVYVMRGGLNLKFSQKEGSHKFPMKREGLVK